MNRDLNVVLSADVSRLITGINQAQGKLAAFGQQAQQIGSVLSIAISAPLGMLAKKAIDAYGELDSLTRGLATLEKNSTTLKARLSELQEVAKLPGLGYKEAIQFDVALRSAGFSADLSKRSMLAFGNALGSIGKGKNELKGVALQLQQLATKASGYGQDIRVIKEYAPQVGAALQAAFGTVDTEKISKMGITGKQVVEKLVAELDKLPKATGGIQNAFENLGDSSFRAFAKMGQAISNSLGLETVLNTLGNAITTLVDGFASLDPNTQKLVAGLGLLAITLPPILATMGLLSTTVIPAVVAGFALLTGPITLTVAAIAGAATLIVMHWDRIKAALADSGVWMTLRTTFASVFGAITSIFGAFANLFQGDWTNLGEHLINVWKFTWNTILSVLNTGVMTFGGVFGKLLSSLGLDKLAMKFKGQMNEVYSFLYRKQYSINSPKAQGDIFAGYNYGGKDAGKDKGDGKKKKVETHIEFLQRQVKELEAAIQNYSSLGLTIPDAVTKSYDYFRDAVKRAEDALLQFQKVDITGVKPIVNNNVAGSMKEGDDQASRYGKFNKALNGGGGYLNPILPNLDKFQKEAANAIKPIKKAMVDLNKDISDGLKNAAESAFVGMGEVIGGLLSGTAGLSDLPKMLLGVLGGLLTQLGQMAIAVGLGVQAIQTALKTLNPFVAIAAGIGLIALGSFVKAGTSKMGNSRPMANGGILSGPQHILAGEYPGAASNPEVVAPLSKLKGMISDGGGGGGMLTTRISGYDLELILERTKRSKQTYGTR